MSSSGSQSIMSMGRRKRCRRSGCRKKFAIVTFCDLVTAGNHVNLNLSTPHGCSFQQIATTERDCATGSRERPKAALPGVEPGRKGVEDAATRMVHGQGPARHPVRRPLYLGVMKTAFTRKS